MKNKLPPLNYFRPFEATARLGSASLAANELGRNHSNVSRYNRLLEEYVGVSLFKRAGSHLTLTEEGKYLYEMVQSALNILVTAEKNLQQNGTDAKIKLKCPSIFINRWLLPRLNNFNQKHENKLLSIQVVPESPVTQENERAITITLEPVKNPATKSVPLMADIIVAVASKNCRFFSTDSSRNSSIHLIETNDKASTWQSWFDLIPELKSRKVNVIEIPDLDLALTAAIEGQGILLARKAMIQPFLEKGCLRLVCSEYMHLDTAYWLNKELLYRENSTDVAFIRWIQTEAILSEEQWMLPRISSNIKRPVEKSFSPDLIHR